MAGRRKQENHWQSISDLMTGLMVIFLFVCLGFIYQLEQTKLRYNYIRDSISQDLQDEFKPEEIARWGTRIDPQNLTVTFIEPSVFFDTNDATVNAHFQQVLEEFMPRYIAVLQKYSDDIVEVRIEGNASREWNGDPNSPEAYYYNMKLSQDRAFNVLQYVYSMGELRAYRPWLQDKLRANGASYSKANDNASASRCVEIYLRRNAEKEIEGLGSIGKK